MQRADLRLEFGKLLLLRLQVLLCAQVLIGRDGALKCQSVDGLLQMTVLGFERFKLLSQLYQPCLP